MRKNNLLILVLMACWIATTGIVARGQQVAGASPGSNGNAEPSPCLNDAQIQLVANPAQITLGQSSVLSWSVTLPSGCASVAVRFNGEVVAKNGSRTITPPGSQTHNLVISHTKGGVFQQRSTSARLEVLFPDRVVIDPSTSNPVQVLLNALGSNPVVIELCDVELDLTGHSLEIGDNTSLIASPRCARGPRSLGPRIFVTNKMGNKPLFAIRGDQVVFSGFRLQGPSDGIYRSDDRLEKGIKIHPFSSREPIQRIEISNMEIFHWSGAAIEVADNNEQLERGRLFNTNVGAVRISNNFIHDNRHASGSGYGVKVGNGAYALIERNVFDQNRHAIAGGSLSGDKKDASGYTLRENLILAGGGVHCPDQWFWGIIGWPNFRCWQTHQVDMHGSQNDWYSDSNWCCGIAGETIVIERNTILYDAGKAIKIRGNPADRALVDLNVFKHASREDAISQNGDLDGNITNPIDVRSNNIFLGKNNPIPLLGSCDFVGDGQQDRFMATGVTWWAQSSITSQWRYLNTMPERSAQLQIGHVDNDGKCDVAIRPSSPVVPPRWYSRNGTTPWTPVQVLDPISQINRP